jgi:membrane protease YdiL (CAAX protease family)
MMHYESSASGMIDVAGGGGVALGWLRWYTGSTLTTIACHIANNTFRA